MKGRFCSAFFDTLATRSRLDLVLTLRDRPKSVGEISGAIAVERTNVSHQLRRLRDCGFVFERREGKKRMYSLNRETVIPILDLAEIHIKKYCKVEKIGRCAQ